MTGHRETPSLRRTRLGLAGLLGGAAVGHVVAPATFESLVPSALPGPREFWNLASAAAEATAAGLMTSRRTAGLGGWLAAATLVAVFPANVEAARSGGYGALPAPWDSAAIAWLRLPLQVPLVWWAVRVGLAHGLRPDRDQAAD